MKDLNKFDNKGSRSNEEETRRLIDGFEKLNGLKASYDRQMRWYYRINKLLIAGIVICVIMMAAVVISRLPAPMPDAQMTLSEALELYGPDAPVSWFQRTMDTFNAIDFAKGDAVLFMIAVGLSIYSLIKSTKRQKSI